jgi:hypothetical protein
MPENNSKYMSTVYLKAEELFDQVHAVKKDYEIWTFLG